MRIGDQQVLALREHLIAEGFTLVVMEATGDYWKPFCYVLEDDFDVLLVNPRHVKNLPGRKTDVSGAAWLADLRAHGLVRGSLVPHRPHPAPVPGVPEVAEATGRPGIKLSSVATDVTGVSGRAMLEALISGQRDPGVLADLAQKRMRVKITALTGRFTDHHAFLARVHLNQIDSYVDTIAETTGRIEVMIAPFRGVRDLLVSIPGVSTKPAEVIIAETGADMTRCPTAAVATARRKDTFPSAKYRRIALRQGRMKALVAIEHAILIAVRNMLTNGAFHQDLGGDYTRRKPENYKNLTNSRTNHMSQVRWTAFEAARGRDRWANALLTMPTDFEAGTRAIEPLNGHDAPEPPSSSPARSNPDSKTSRIIWEASSAEYADSAWSSSCVRRQPRP